MAYPTWDASTWKEGYYDSTGNWVGGGDTAYTQHSDNNYVEGGTTGSSWITDASGQIVDWMDEGLRYSKYDPRVRTILEGEGDWNQKLHQLAALGGDPMGKANLFTGLYRDGFLQKMPGFDDAVFQQTWGPTIATWQQQGDDEVGNTGLTGDDWAAVGVLGGGGLAAVGAPVAAATTFGAGTGAYTGGERGLYTGAITGAATAGASRYFDLGSMLPQGEAGVGDFGATTDFTPRASPIDFGNVGGGTGLPDDLSQYRGYDPSNPYQGDTGWGDADLGTDTLAGGGSVDTTVGGGDTTAGGGDTTVGGDDTFNPQGDQNTNIGGDVEQQGNPPGSQDYDLSGLQQELEAYANNPQNQLPGGGVDWEKFFSSPALWGPLVAGIFGYAGAEQYGDNLSGIYNDMVARRQPFLDQSLAWLNNPGQYFETAGKAAVDATLRGLSVGGNPFDDPFKLTLATEAGMRDWRNAWSTAANLGLSGEDSRASVATGAAGANLNALNVLGGTAGSIINPPRTVDQIMADIIKAGRGGATVPV